MFSKIIPVLIFLAVVCSYANADEEQTEADSTSMDDEDRALTKEECYRKIFSENMYGGGFGLFYSSENISVPFFFAANIPLSKEGPWALDIELGIDVYFPRHISYISLSPLAHYVFSPEDKYFRKDRAGIREMKMRFGKNGYRITSYYLEAGPILTMEKGDMGPVGFVSGGGWRVDSSPLGGGVALWGLRLKYLNSLQIGLNLSALL
ncbi:hypothetical protein R83H12_02758 [Fibrobacteria bacterium R8-3-H12]